MLTPLPSEKTAIFPISLLDKSKVFVRRGTHADGSCFFHAYLQAIRKREYRNAPYEARLEMVQEIRDALIAAVSRESLAAISDGTIYRLLFSEQLRGLIEAGAKPILTTTAHLDIIGAFERAMTTPQNFYVLFLQDLQDQLGPNLPRGEKRDLAKWCYEIFTAAESASLAAFRKSLLGEVDSTHIEYISRVLKVNFFFFYYTDTVEGVQPYPNLCARVDHEWNFIAMLWLNESHYELIGEMDENKRITCLFAPDSETGAKLRLGLN